MKFPRLFVALRSGSQPGWWALAIRAAAAAAAALTAVFVVQRSVALGYVVLALMAGGYGAGLLACAWVRRRRGSWEAALHLGFAGASFFLWGLGAQLLALFLALWALITAAIDLRRLPHRPSWFRRSWRFQIVFSLLLGAALLVFPAGVLRDVGFLGVYAALTAMNLGVAEISLASPEKTSGAAPPAGVSGIGEQDF